MKDSILETGKCKLRGYAYPVKIYATDGGRDNNQVHGAYQDVNGWQSCTWDKHGNKLFGGNPSLSSFNLIPIPVTKYFNIYTDYRNMTWTGVLYDTLEEAKDSWHRNDGYTAELFSYSEGVVERVACSC